MASQLFKDTCNERLYAKIYEQHAKDLHDFIYYKFGQHLNPEDKVHEAFIKLWQNCKSIPPEKAKSFLFTVVNNLTLNEIKHNKVVLKYQNTQPKSHTNESPEFLLEEKQYMKKFQDALAKLSEPQRVAFLMNRVEGKRHQEIADILNISRKAVEKRIYTALDKLRKDIDEI